MTSDGFGGLSTTSACNRINLGNFQLHHGIFASRLQLIGYHQLLEKQSAMRLRNLLLLFAVGVQIPVE